MDVVQLGLSLIDYPENRTLIGHCRKLGIGVVVYEPLANGILTGKTLEQVQQVWREWTEAAFYKRLLAPGKAEQSFAVADGMRPIADRMGISVAQLAIGWVLCQPGVTAAITGSRSARHVRENAAAAEVTIPSAVLDELEALIPLGPAQPKRSPRE